ncbi:hypothetical protein FGB62_96g16 [Gracilaria domingensis]|nr:hypothetical protein FGB62_96g16 [Gracilaria domingensis]
MDSLASCGFETFQSGPQTLFAGRDQQVVGFVEFTLSSAGISVTYTVTDPRCTLTDDVHVNIVNTQLSRVSPGRFPCKTSVPGSPTTFSIECPASFFTDLSCCDTLLVYTHGVLDCGTEEETVYSGTPACSGRQWCNAVSVEPPCECECVGSACVQPQDCAISSPGSCDSGSVLCPADCAPPPQVDCGGYPTSCTFDLVCDASECEPVTPCVGLCPPEGVCPSGPATPEIPAVCTSPNECSCGGTLTCGDPTDPANCPIQPIVCDSTTCSPGMTLCPDDCGMPSDCGLGCLEPIIECPSDCPAACPVDCECPNCFLPDISTGVCQCIPDPTVNDATCDPCEGASRSICQDAGLPSNFGWYVNSFIMLMSNASCLLLLTIYFVLSVCSCPLSSGCKQGAIPDRIGVTQAELAVSLICSSSCGESCDVISGGESRVCSLFGTINLGVDGDASTDDVIGMCPDLTVQ